MGTGTVEDLTKTDINKTRADLLKSVGASERDLRARADSYQLSEREYVVWRRLRALDWLRGA